MAKLRRGIRYVVFADIAGFYDNIDLALLYSDLNALGADQDLLSVLRTCLDRWSKPRGRGIPQGYSASDILAKVYMGPVDLGLRNSGFKHVRYVDDIRIFCRSNLEAKKALLRLTDLLRNRGLILQTAKTDILTVDKARTEIDGIGPLIESIQAELQAELKEVYGSASSYATVDDLDRALKSRPDAPPPEVLERAFDEHFSVRSGGQFNQTLLHYLLTRLGKVKSRVAVNFCLAVLGRRPEETEHVLRYLGDVGLTTEERDEILRYAGSSEAIYDYQLYQIVRWFFERDDVPQKLVSLCRVWATDRNRQNWLRSYSLAVLGKAGDPADLEMIEQGYSSATSEVEKAEIVMALVRMEIGRRNAFYKRVSPDGQLVKWAVEEALRGKRN